MDPERVVLDVDGARAGQGRLEHVEVVAHGLCRALVGQAEHLVDDPVVGDAEAQGQATLETAWVERACWASAIGCRGWMGTTAVPISMRVVSRPMTVAAVRASNSSGICGTQTEASPASSAQRASATSRSTLVA